MCRLPFDGPKVPLTRPAAQSQRQQQYDDQFLQYTYKVVPCDKTWRHDYSTCPFAHSGESSERRHPSTYLPFMCNSTQHSTDLKEKCPFGTSCKYAHGHFELWLHPGRFRTKMCSLGDKTQGSPACSSDACDDPLALWTAAMAPQPPVLDSFGLQLQSSLMADAAAGLSEAAIAASASSLWLANNAMLPQPGVAAQLPLPAAATSLYGNLLPQQQLVMANSAVKPISVSSYGPVTNAGAVQAGTADLLSSWMVAQNVAPAADRLAGLASGNPLAAQQLPCAGSAALVPGAPVQMPCMPMRNMLQQSALEPWLRADTMPCYPPGLPCMLGSTGPQAADSNMLQFLSSLPDSTVQQLLGMLAVDAQPSWGSRA
eukprot:gene13425-13553_t